MLQVTVFTKFKTCMGDVNLIDVLYDIRNGKYAPAVNRIRLCMDKDDTEAADRLKKGLPAVTISATYRKRRVAGCMTGYNPLTILDIDGLPKAELPPPAGLASRSGLYGGLLDQSARAWHQSYCLPGGRT